MTGSTTTLDGSPVQLLHGYRLALVSAVCLAGISTVAMLAVPLIVKTIVTAFATHGPITGPIALMIGAALLAAITSAFSSYLLSWFGERALLRLRSRAIEHTLRLPLSTVRGHGSGALVTRITSDTVLFRAVLDVGVVQLPLAGLTVVFTLIVMALLSWPLLLVTIASFALSIFVITVVLRRVRPNVLAQQEAMAGLAQRFTAQLAALATIKSYRAERLAADGLTADAAQLTKTSLGGARLQALISPVMNLGQQIALVSVIIGGGALIADGRLSTASFAAFLLYLLQLVSPVTMAALGIGRLQAGFAARTRLRDLLALPVERDTRAAPEAGTGLAGDTPGTAELGSAPETGDAIMFRDVVFSYTGRPDLAGLSFRVPRTGLTAMVGPSGAGKSTALALVERFAWPDSGSIHVFGREVRSWPLAELRRRIAYVDQQFTLLEGTVRENLRLGRPEPVTDADLFGALTSVGLAETIRALPEGLDTVLGRDHDLSGGQRQRLALARALLSDADLVLLDEPTSQLDGLNEDRFRIIVDSLAAHRAVLVVAHRLSTVLHADHVVLVSAGRMVDSGAHAELLDRCSPYRDLVSAQTRGSGALAGGRRT